MVEVFPLMIPIPSILIIGKIISISDTSAAFSTTSTAWVDIPIA